MDRLTRVILALNRILATGEKDIVDMTADDFQMARILAELEVDNELE